MKHEIKVGDFVKLPHWTDYFKVTAITEKEVEVVQEDKYYATYSLNLGFIKKEQDMKIDPSKKYRKVSTHEPVRIICADRVTQGDTFPFVGLRKGVNGIEVVEYFDQEGRDPRGNLSIEEVPQTDWSKVQVDTLIWVAGVPRYFHSYSTVDSMVLYFRDGATSITSANGVAWNYSYLCSLEKPLA